MARELARVLEATGRRNVSAIARAAGRDRAQVHRILTGRVGCSVYMAEHLAQAAEVDLAYLY